jgi:hypothetical protein
LKPGTGVAFTVHAKAEKKKNEKNGLATRRQRNYNASHCGN